MNLRRPLQQRRIIRRNVDQLNKKANSNMLKLLEVATDVTEKCLEFLAEAGERWNQFHVRWQCIPGTRPNSDGHNIYRRRSCLLANICAENEGATLGLLDPISDKHLRGRTKLGIQQPPEDQSLFDVKSCNFVFTPFGNGAATLRIKWNNIIASQALSRRKVCCKPEWLQA